MEKQLETLKVAFDIVAPKGPGRDWKDPINWSIREDCGPALFKATGVTLDDIREAIVHYTATVPTVTREVHSCDYGPDVAILRVTADGYRKGPAGDH